MRRSVALAVAIVAFAVAVTGASAQVLRVGSYRGAVGQFGSIQAAIDAAKPGDWILVGPGDYHERADHRLNRGPQPATTPSAVVISTPRLYLRGMNRNRVVVDGTKPGSHRCGAQQANQDFGVPGPDGKPLGRNGILVWKADNVWVQNLTACNFLNGVGRVGNQIWWNGGDGGGKIGGHGYDGSYLTATSTFYKDSSTAAQYGIFTSDWNGGAWDQLYASNMSDSDFYIGGCQQVCAQTVDHIHAQYSVQGFSGTNAGGAVVIRYSEFDHNKTGVTAGALNNDDWPSPQDGACPGRAPSAITHTYSCWVFMHNYVHDNNNPNVPGVGVASNAPTGTGLMLYGGRDNTIMNNVFANNGAWGVTMFSYPDTETPPQDVIAAGAACRGGISSGPASNFCLYDDWGNAVLNNTFQHNGFFGNDSNADFGEVTTTAAPTNCFHGNVEAGGGHVTSSPAGLQQSKPACDRHMVLADPNGSMTSQLICDTQAFSTPCPAGSNYPQSTGVKMPGLPHLTSMPNPCAGVPANPWCSGQTTIVSRCFGARVVHARLSVAVRERLRSITVRVAGGRARTYRATGGSATVPVDLGTRRGRVAVSFTETIKVGSHVETIRFVRVYRGC